MRCVVVAVLCVACGGGGAGVDAGPQADGGTPSFDELPAYVHVSEGSDNMGGAYSAGVSAAFRSSTVTPYEVAAEAGDCRLLHGSGGGFCTEPCDGYCLAGDTCLPFPPQSSAGTLTITGLDQAVNVTPTDGVYYSWYTEGAVFQPGTDVTATAAGDDYPPFTLTVPPPAPLVVTNLDELEPAGDRDLVIEWQAAGGPEGRVFLRLITDLGHAQVHPVVIECDVPDTGSLAVPQSMMAEYADPENWSCGDCFSSMMERYTRATRFGEATVELRASSRISIYLPVY
jgi:hypothetical protein